MSHPLVPIVAAGVAGISLVLALLATRAYRRTQENKLLFVAGAFLLFFIKNAVVAYDIQAGMIGHDRLELFSSLLDLAVVGLLVAPFVRP